MALTLDDVAGAYLADTEYLQTLQIVREKRDASIPALQAITYQFIRGESNLQGFRTQLQNALSKGEDWGANGWGFMMELHKMGKYHDEHDPIAETELRTLLTGLNAANEGQHIERLYHFFLQERERLRQEGKSSGMTVSARNSAFLISLFAFWLDPAEEPIVYYDSMRKGLYTLVKSKVVPAPPALQLGPNVVEVRTDADHQACREIVAYMAHHAPQLKMYPYWAEYFCRWVTDHFQSLADPSSTLIKESDNSALLAQAPTRGTAIKEQPVDYALEVSLTQTSLDKGPETINHEPLQSVPEMLLARLIREVQRHILVDEAVIRRIYHALLAGHVILTGPPGTGKTELARIIPEILWQTEAERASEDDQPALNGNTPVPTLSTKTAYATRVVTATDEWSVRTLISGIAPQNKNGTVSYTMQYGYLTGAILKNWYFSSNSPEEWSTLRRTLVNAQSAVERGEQKTFRGQWLVIDEFNRAPIDLALGDALTALGGNDVLRVAIEGGSAELPIPQDFRIIGTLNSFDRNYLNQISEALKRRFSFVEILPPTREQRAAEQGIVLYKALTRVSHLSHTISIDEDGTLYWQDEVMIGRDTTGTYAINWDNEHPAFRQAFEAAWCLFEVIRVYRQLGTAQAISLFQHMLIAGMLQGYTSLEIWIEQALDAALCDTIADQLQVLLPDEIDVLLLYLTADRASFGEAYNNLLGKLSPGRVYGQLLSLGSVIDDDGHAYLTDEEIEQIAAQQQPGVPTEKLRSLFHLRYPTYRLPQFTRRLRTFKAERGL
jgi:MoxR-like ATPase